MAKKCLLLPTYASLLPLPFLCNPPPPSPCTFPLHSLISSFPLLRFLSLILDSLPHFIFERHRPSLLFVVNFFVCLDLPPKPYKIVTRGWELLSDVLSILMAKIQDDPAEVKEPSVGVRLMSRCTLNTTPVHVDRRDRSSSISSGFNDGRGCTSRIMYLSTQQAECGTTLLPTH
jgi:hypothetical protein